MTTPVTNNNLTQVGSKKSTQAEELGLGSGRRADQGSGSEVNDRQYDAVTVSHTAQVLIEQSSERGQGGIQSAEHAAQIAQGLKALFEGSSGQAIAA